MEGNVYVYQVNPVSRIIGEGGGGSEGRGGLILIKSKRGGRPGGKSVRVEAKYPCIGINMTVLRKKKKMHQLS